MLRKVGLVALTIALVLAVGVMGVWGYGLLTRPAAAQGAESGYKATDSITVIGQASVRKAPDIAQISIGVETMAETVTEAVKENDGKMKAILAALKAAGIADKDIQTMNYSISFERYPQPVAEGTSAEAKPQYRVSNMANVTVRDLDAVDEVLDAVVEAGANNIWGVSFSLDKPQAAQAEARGDAIADAKARAEALAGLAGVKVGPVMSVSEVLGSGVVSMPVAMERAAAASGSISPGEIEVTYQVQVVYYIER